MLENAHFQAFITDFMFDYSPFTKICWLIKCERDLIGSHV